MTPTGTSRWTRWSGSRPAGSSSPHRSRSPCGAGFVPVRKDGKLPAATYQASYELEYGEATIEVHQDAFAPGDRVLVIDDVLATGGTVQACTSLLEQCGAEVVGTAVLIELSFLSGRARLNPAHPLTSLLTV